MSEAENKTIAQRFNEDVWGRGDEAALEKLLAPTSSTTAHSPLRRPTATDTSRS
jgi:hypothetical protein